jgi:hypothetical protein
MRRRSYWRDWPRVLILAAIMAAAYVIGGLIGVL